MKAESKIILFGLIVFLFIMFLNLNHASLSSIQEQGGFYTDGGRTAGTNAEVSGKTLIPTNTDAGRFVGTWEGSTPYGEGVIVFKSDNTFHGTSGFYGVDGSWYIAGGKLVVSTMGRTASVDYVFSNQWKTVTLTYNGMNVILEKR
jgi:hypothetical protein